MQECIDIPRAFIEVWFPSYSVIISPRGETLIALGYLLLMTIGARLLYLKQDQDREKVKDDAPPSPSPQGNVHHLLRPLG